MTGFTPSFQPEFAHVASVALALAPERFRIGPHPASPQDVWQFFLRSQYSVDNANRFSSFIKFCDFLKQHNAPK